MANYSLLFVLKVLASAVQFFKFRSLFTLYFVFKVKYCMAAGMVGAVGKISAFRPQGLQFDPGSVCATFFPT